MKQRVARFRGQRIVNGEQLPPPHPHTRPAELGRDWRFVCSLRVDAPGRAGLIIARHGQYEHEIAATVFGLSVAFEDLSRETD